MDSALDTLFQCSALAMDSLKRPQPLTLSGSAVRPPTKETGDGTCSFTFSEGVQLGDVEDEGDEDEGVAGLSVTVMMLVVVMAVLAIGTSTYTGPFSTSCSSSCGLSVVKRASFCCRKRWKSFRTG